MGRLIIVSGASGAGKSFLLQNISRWDSSIETVKKLSTRTPRSYETEDVQHWLDLKFDQPMKSIESCDYKYLYGNAWYGTRKSDIESVFVRGKNPILIIRDCETIYKIKRDFNNALVFYVQSGLSGNDLRSKLKEQGREDIEIEERMQRLMDDFHDYVRHVDLFDHVLVNYFDSQTLLDQMRCILRHKLPSGIIQPDLVFVLMPFKQEFDDVYMAIQMAGRLINRRPLCIDRMDEKRGAYHISDEILRRIQEAALIVAEVTEYNPNVFFEVGYARGIGKPVLPIAQKGSELAFDLKDFRTIFYKTPTQLADKLSKEFRHCFKYFASQSSE
jgi:guanylate kinase